MDNKLKQELQYNFVFYFVHDDFWKAIIGPSNEYMHVYDYTMGKTFIGKFISHIYWSYSIRSRIKLPFKKIWYKYMYNQNFKKRKPLCFVYVGGKCVYFDDGWCEYVRKRNPQNKQVALHGDLISKKITWDYEELRKKMDLCSTYDKGESQKYGIHFFSETVYTKLIPEKKITEFENDVYFLGAIKDRFSKIMETYLYLKRNGIKCKFILVGVPKEYQNQYEGIEYSKGITYEENLKNVINSKCILELIQSGSSNTTLRAREAIAYRRRLISDCKNVNRDFFNDNQLQIINRPEDIDIAKIIAVLNPNDYTPRIDMSPIKRLIDLQQALDKNGKQPQNFNNCSSI